MTGKYNLYQKAMITLQNKLFNAFLKSANTKNDLQQFVQNIKVRKKNDWGVQGLLKEFPDEAKLTTREKQLVNHDKLQPGEKLKLKNNFIKNLPAQFQIQKVTYQRKADKDFANLLVRESSKLPLPEYPGDAATYCLMSNGTFNREKFISLLSEWSETQFRSFCRYYGAMHHSSAGNNGYWATDCPNFPTSKEDGKTEYSWYLTYFDYDVKIGDQYKLWTDDNRPEFQLQVISFQKHIFQRELSLQQTTYYLLQLADFMYHNSLLKESYPEAEELRFKYGPNDTGNYDWEFKSNLLREEVGLVEGKESELRFMERSELYTAFKELDRSKHAYSNFQAALSMNEKKAVLMWIKVLTEDQFEHFCDGLRALQMFHDMNTGCWGFEKRDYLLELENDSWLFEYLMPWSN
jgi:hypothetical protein